MIEQDFPKSTNKYLKASMFQDQEIRLTFIGWEKKGNEDIEGQNGKAGISWKQRLKYQLRYSYPEWALDEAGEKLTDKSGNPFKNKFYDPKYPKGYSITYHFEEGQLESGSLPLFEAFCLVRPKKGNTILITRTGQERDTKWKVKLKGTVQNASNDGLPEIQLGDETNEETQLVDGEEAPF